MDPITLSLISVASTGQAVRRLAGAIDAARARAHAACAPWRVDRAPSDLLAGLEGLAAAPVAVRRLVPPGAEALAARLARFAAAHGLLLSFQVALDAIFAADDPRAARALAARRVAVLLTTPDGAPVCGLDLTPDAGPCHRDRVRQRAFARAGLPLLRVALCEAWDDLRPRLEALAPGPEPDPDPAAPAPRLALRAEAA